MEIAIEIKGSEYTIKLLRDGKTIRRYNGSTVRNCLALLAQAMIVDDDLIEMFFDEALKPARGAEAIKPMLLNASEFGYAFTRYRNITNHLTTKQKRDTVKT